LKWSRTARGASRCGPVLGLDGTVIAATSAEVLGLDPGTGKARWRYALPADEGAQASTPIVDGEGSIYLCTRMGTLVVLTGGGQERFRAPGPFGGVNPAAPALGPDGRLYVGLRSSSGAVDRFSVVAIGEP
jgi:outer membrane protein assembly factor BamB